MSMYYCHHDDRILDLAVLKNIIAVNIDSQSQAEGFEQDYEMLLSDLLYCTFRVRLMNQLAFKL